MLSEDDSRRAGPKELRLPSVGAWRGHQAAFAGATDPAGANPGCVLPPKLVRPSAAGLVARERVFALLDRFRRPIIWVDGPPGAGKTSLISSWIETRAMRCLWYRVDAGDANPVTFFHQLAQVAPTHAARLPALTPGNLTDLAGFARRFFRALRECVPDFEIVVLDDFQNVPEGSALPILVGELARADTSTDHLRDGLPCMLSIKGSEPAFPPRTGLSVVVLSRSRPPAELARAIAYGDLTRLSWEDLQPDIEETRRFNALSDSAGELLPRAPSARTDIETEVATRLINTRELHARTHDSAARSRPIQITTLGRFEVTVSGEVPRHTRKAQRRVLDLLKALVALGPEGVSRDAVAGALWPDSEGDAARDAFEVTLHRLRKMLGRDDAIQLAQRMLHVNRAVVWVDVLAFARLVADSNDEHGALRIGPAERALALYGGPFLHNEEDAPWLLPARERLRSRYVRLAISAAQYFERSGRSERSVEIYATALEAEPLAEELHRRLMVCLATQGRHAEALDVYRRCRQMLSLVLGVAPSRETEALHHSITKAA